MQVEQGEQVLMSKEQALDKITTFMGGRAAEEIIFDTVTSGASNDIEQATKIARAMVTRFGMSEEFDMMALETVNNPYLGEMLPLWPLLKLLIKLTRRSLRFSNPAIRKQQSYLMRIRLNSMNWQSTF